MTGNSDLVEEVGALAGVRVLCIGDVMLDRFVHGAVERISPEGPIPVLRVDHETAMLGGVGNVVRNLVALGARASLVSVIGDDDAGHAVTKLFAGLPETEPVLLIDRDRGTTIKTRYLAGNQQMLRADRESSVPVSDRTQEQISRRVEALIGDCAVVVLSDYAKGVLSEPVIGRIIALARDAGIRVVVDPKGPNYARYSGAFLLTPNRQELADATRMPVDGDAAVAAAARRLREANDLDAILATRGADGMTLVDGAGEASHLPAEAREVFDVSGAGDTVVATAAAAIAAGLPMIDAARLANAAAGIVVGKTGTAAVESSELVAALHTQDLLTGGAKIVTLAQAVERVDAWRRKGRRIGFTNGCFDLLHPGHVSLLGQARRACDVLVVGLNSDASTQRLKGAERPVQSEAARAAVLASLATVDLVVVFPEDTPMALLETLKPDVLIKGADYAKSEVVGADLVEGYGGRVVLADLVPGHSTTATIAKTAK